MGSVRTRPGGSIAGVSAPASLAAVRHRALALRSSGDLSAACRLLADAIDSARPTYGEDHPEVMGALYLLARLHREADEPTAARRLLEEAYAAGERRWSPADPLMLALAFDLAGVAEELGNRHEARRNYTRVATAGPPCSVTSIPPCGPPASTWASRPTTRSRGLPRPPRWQRRHRPPHHRFLRSTGTPRRRHLSRGTSPRRRPDRESSPRRPRHHPLWRGRSPHRPPLRSAHHPRRAHRPCLTHRTPRPAGAHATGATPGRHTDRSRTPGAAAPTDVRRVDRPSARCTPRPAGVTRSTAGLSAPSRTAPRHPWVTSSAAASCSAGGDARLRPCWLRIAPTAPGTTVPSVRAGLRRRTGNVALGTVPPPAAPPPAAARPAALPTGAAPPNAVDPARAVRP